MDGKLRAGRVADWVGPLVREEKASDHPKPPRRLEQNPITLHRNLLR